MTRTFKGHIGTILTFGAAMILLAACATATPYQPLRVEHGEPGGYSDEQLGPDRYSVAFAGNTLTSRERVEQYMLFRAAELSLRDGYDGFRMVDKTTECDRQTVTELAPDYDPTVGPASSRPSWRYYYDGRWTDHYPYDVDSFDTSRTVTRMIERFEAHAEIELLRAPLDLRKYGVFDARRVIEEMGSSIEYPES